MNSGYSISLESTDLGLQVCVFRVSSKARESFPVNLESLVKSMGVEIKNTKISNGYEGKAYSFGAYFANSLLNEVPL